MKSLTKKRSEAAQRQAQYDLRIDKEWSAFRDYYDIPEDPDTIRRVLRAFIDRHNYSQSQHDRLLSAELGTE